MGTVAISDRQPLSFGNMKAMLATVTGSSSYIEDGDTVTPGDTGITTILGCIILGAPGGYAIEYVPATGKMIWRLSGTADAVLNEVADTTDLDGVSFPVIFFGH